MYADPTGHDYLTIVKYIPVYVLVYILFLVIQTSPTIVGLVSYTLPNILTNQLYYINITVIR